MTKLTARTRREVSADWRELVPDFCVFRPMNLMKKHGPVIVGIYLKPNRGGTEYYPTGYMHNLCMSSPAILISCAVEVGRVGARSHNREVASLALRRLADEFPLLMSDVVSCDDVLRQYEREVLEDIELRERDLWFACHWRSILGAASLLALGGASEASASLVNLVDGRLSEKHLVSNQLADARRAVAALRSGADVQETVDEEVVAHKLGGLPTLPFLVSVADPSRIIEIASR